MLSKLGAEYLTQPLHVTLAAGVVKLFGGFRTKVKFDLVRRRYHAYSLLQVADWAAERGIRTVTAIEAGVASGQGMRNMIDVGALVTKETGVKFQIVGFDMGTGLPPPRDYRDHPEVWKSGDFKMPDMAEFQRSLPDHARVIVGDVADTIPAFVKTLTPEAPLGYAVIDVDYYSSARDTMRVLQGPPDCYLPATLVYFDDIGAVVFPWANDWCGERLAIREFNETNELRKLQLDVFRKYGRIYKDSDWLDRVYTLHVLDHKQRRGASDFLR